MGLKVDEVFADFRMRFEGAEGDAARMDAMMGRVGRSTGAASDQLDRADRAARRAGKGARAGARDMTGLNRVLKSVKSSALAALAAFVGFEGIRRLISGSVRTFVGFRTEMNNVRAITNATNDDQMRLTATAKELGRTTQFTATQAAEAMTFLARTGLTVNEVIGVLPGTLNLAAATAVDLGTAADISTNILKGMGLEVSELDSVVDVLAMTTNSANVNIFELGEGMKVVAPLASAAGQSVEQMAAMLGILGDAGIKGTLAGTSLRRMILNLTTEAGTAGGAIERLGLRTRDSEGNFLGLADIMEQLGGIATTDADLFELFGARGVNAAQVLLKSGGAAIDGFAEKLENAAGTAERMRKQQMEGLPGATKRLQASFEGFQIFLGDVFEPQLISVADVISKTLIPFFRRFIAVVALIGTATGTAIKLSIQGWRQLANVATIAVGTILKGAGRLIRELGELGERFGIGGELASGLANAGLHMERMANSGVRKALDGAAERSQDIADIWSDAGDRFDEIIEASEGVAEGVAAVTEETQRLNDELDKTQVAFSGMVPDLNLAGFETQLSELQTRIRGALSLGGEGAFSLQETLAVQQQLGTLTEKRREEVEAMVEAEQALQSTLIDIKEITEEIGQAESAEDVKKLTDQLTSAIQGLARQTRAADKAMGKFGKSGKKAVKDTTDEAQIAVRAVNRIADAFGLLNDDIRQAVDGLLDMLRVLGDIEKNAKGAKIGLAQGLGLAAGGIAIAGALGSAIFGKSPEEAAREANIIQNTDALKQLRVTFEKSLAVLGQFTGTQLESVASQLDGLIAELLRINEGIGPDFVLDLDKVPGSQRLRDVADAFGIALDGSVESFQALAAAIAQLDLERLTETFEGAADIADRRAALLDLSAEDQLKETVKLLNEFGNLPETIRKGMGLALSRIGSAEGRAAFKDILKGLFEQITSGELGLDALGGLTLDQLLDMIQKLDNLTDEISADDDAGATNSFLRDSRITVAQGEIVVTLLDQLVTLGQFQLDELRAMNGREPIRPPGLGVTTGVLGRGGIGVQPFVINGGITVPITVTAVSNNPAETGRELGGGVIEGIDEALEELATRKRRATGE